MGVSPKFRKPLGVPSQSPIRQTVVVSAGSTQVMVFLVAVAPAVMVTVLVWTSSS